MEIARDFIVGGGSSILVIDASYELLTRPQMATALTHTLRRLTVPLHRSGCILLFLVSLPTGFSTSLAATRPLHEVLAHHAAARLMVQRERWRQTRQGFRGYSATVRILKPMQKQVTITFDGVLDTEK